MKLYASLERTILTIITVGALVALMGLVVSHNSRAAGTDVPQGEHMVTIHDRGSERGIMTRADTLRQAFKEANIPIDSEDLVEPGLDEKLTASNYEVNVYRARPVVIVDGVSQVKIMSPYQAPEQIAKQAGVALYPEDATTMTRLEEVVEKGAGLELRISRATPFTFTLYGKTFEARTQAKTVGEMLKSKNITLGPEDGASASMDAPIVDGMSVAVWRNGKQTITVEEAVAMPVRQIKDMEKDPSYKQVQTAGKPGKKNVTYEIDIRDGKEVGRTEISSVVTDQPTEQVEVVGGKLPTPTNPTENQALGHQMMLDYGFGEDQWSCLYTLWTRESGWRINASNPSGAYGIPQALPGSKMGEGWQTDARVQIQWGLGYIKGRYSTPCGAWAAFQSKGWY